MGFLSAYDGTRKIAIGDPERGYWVEVAEHVSQGAREDAEKALSNIVMVGSTAKPQPNVARYRQLLVLASIRDWNLDDDQGNTWPIDLKHVQMLPGTEFDKLHDTIDKLNKPMDAQEQRQFPVEGVSGDQDGSV